MFTCEQTLQTFVFVVCIKSFSCKYKHWFGPLRTLTGLKQKKRQFTLGEWKLWCVPSVTGKQRKTYVGLGTELQTEPGFWMASILLNTEICFVILCQISIPKKGLSAQMFGHTGANAGLVLNILWALEESSEWDQWIWTSNCSVYVAVSPSCVGDKGQGCAPLLWADVCAGYCTLQ